MKNFEQAYEGYFNRIYRLIFRLTGQEEDAKDRTYKVAANTCLNHLKRKIYRN